MPRPITPGETAYEAYRDNSGGISLISKEPIPRWSALPDDVKKAWEAAAEKVLDDYR